MNIIEIYTDGACSGNPGAGGWAAILIFNDFIKEIYGYEEYTTNNKMELTAAIEALKTLNTISEVKLYTDSTYVKQGITEWITKWKKNNWLTSSKKLVKNLELWQNLDKLNNYHSINWQWIKGHSINELNNKVDKLAKLAIKSRTNL